MSPKTRRRFWWTLASLAVLVALLGVVAVKSFNDEMSRFYTYGLWWEAYHAYREQYSEAPRTIEDMERVYNTYDRCQGQLPDATVPRPYYFRPPDDDDRYVVLIEPIRSGHFRRSVYLSVPGGKHLSYESVWRWNVSGLLEQDQQHRTSARDRAARVQTHPSSLPATSPGRE